MISMRNVGDIKKLILHAFCLIVATAIFCAVWIGCNDIGTGGNTNKNGEADDFLNWLNETNYTLTTNVTPSGSGSVTRDPNQINYKSGTVVTVKATAASGYTFTRWSGASTSTNATVAVTMNNNKTLTANFQFNIAMVYVPGGTFTMGCTSEQGNDCRSSESPTHRVTLSSFYIGETEITQGQWKAVMGSNPSYHKGDNLPVTNVNWNEVQTFITTLNNTTGKKYRLPTEAEWEYAARGGGYSNGYKYSGSNTIDGVAWYEGNSDSTTHPVGTKTPNELGIYDMSGNVFEWVSDRYGNYSSTAVANPTGPSSGLFRIIRGGSVGKTGALYCRVSSRNWNDPNDRYNDVGFRLALDP